MTFFTAKELVNQVCGPAQEGETAPRTSGWVKGQPLSTPHNNPELTTLPRLLTWCVQKYGNQKAMGSRHLIRTTKETKNVTKVVGGQKTQVQKDWIYFEMSGFEYITYNDLAVRVQDLASGILSLGVKPGDKERFHIYGATSAPWFQMALALNSETIPLVTSYDTLGQEGLTHSLRESQSVGIFLDNHLLKNVATAITDGASNLRLVVLRDHLTDADKERANELQTAHPSVKVLSFAEVVQEGKKNPSPKRSNDPSPDDIALIMYTSGSTGTPKGVVLTHRNVIGGLAGVTGNVDSRFVHSRDRILAYLPLAHILEYLFELYALYNGGCLGYGSIKTLSDINMRNSAGDIREFKPHIMCGVPAVWETIKKGIVGKVKQESPLVQSVFWSAYRAKVALAKYGFSLPGEGIIFKKVRAQTGGCLRFVLNGGAGIATETQEFISTLLAPVLIGYGLTETCANAALMTPLDLELGVTGRLTASTVGKLVDVPELNYFAKNNQGELLLKSPSVMVGYLTPQDETPMTDDGYFRTGDIGEWTADGQLKLIDRRKNLVKTRNGEYVAIERLEMVYRSNELVQNICVYANSDNNNPVAFVVPKEDTFVQLAKSLDVSPFDLSSPKLTKAVTDSLNDTGKENGFVANALLCGVVLQDEEWTPENGMLTSAQKLQRRAILDTNKDAARKVFAQAAAN